MSFLSLTVEVFGQMGILQHYCGMCTPPFLTEMLGLHDENKLFYVYYGWSTAIFLFVCNTCLAQEMLHCIYETFLTATISYHNFTLLNAINSINEVLNFVLGLFDSFTV
jgi:hypothetical protein